MKQEEIILIGGGGHCRSVIDVIEQENKFRITGILDLKEKIGKSILGYPIIADDEAIASLTKEFKYFHITLGFLKNPNRRIELYNELIAKGAHLPVILSPMAYVSKHAQIGNGTVIMHMAQVNAGSQIGENCIINSKALIEHDAIIGNHTHVSTGAIVNGDVIVEEASFVGSNSIIIQGAKVPAKSFVKANQLFIRR